MSVHAAFCEDGFLSLHLEGPVRGGTPRVEVGDAALTVLALSQPGTFLVPVPGWIWRVARERRRARVVLRCAGATASARECVLSPARVRERLVAFAAAPVETQDSFSLVTALEHVHYADLWPQLPGAVRDFLSAAANRTGLTELLPPTESARPRQGGSHVLFKQIGRALRGADPDAAAEVVRDCCARAGPDAASRRGLLLALTPHFCRIERIEALYKVLRAPEDPPIAPDWSRHWELSATLPGCALGNNLTAARQIIMYLADRSEWWANPETIVWTLRYVLSSRDDRFPETERAGIIRAFAAYVDGHTARHYGFAPNAALRSAAATLLDPNTPMSESLQQEIGARLMRCYGMSPGFWHQVTARAGPLPAPLQEGRDAFGSLVAESAAGPGRAAALQQLERLGVQQVSRVRLELAGPAGSLPACPARTRRDDPESAALRALAAPGAPAMPELAATAAAAQRVAYPDMAHADDWALQRATTDAAIALLEAARPAPAQAHDDALETFAAQLSALSRAAGGFYGPGVGLSLLADLLAAGAHRVAEGLAAALESPLRHVATRDSAAMAAHPHMRSAAARLRAHDAAPARRVLAQLPPDLRAAPARPGGEGDLSGPALFDALVVVCSTQANLDTRLPRLRAGWLGDLARFGIAHLVAVGGAQTRQRGAVLELDISDAPEDRPRKMLALVEWVLRNTDAGHLVKVDDDCELDVAAYFGNQGYRGHAYYGRPVTAAQAGRMRHRPHATGRAGRHAIEKLPQDLIHADGTTGYSLDRTAMARLAEVAATPRGQWLAAGAYCEDRLVGALLAEAGLAPCGEDYVTASFHAARPGGVIVTQGAAGFHPDAQGVTKLAHHGAARTATAAQRPAGVLLPRRIWPTHVPPRLGPDSNSMQLLSSEARLATVAAGACVVVAVTRNERAMMGHFLAHYRRLGVSGFLIVDNLSDDGTPEHLLAEPDVALFSADTAFRRAVQGTDWKVALMAHYRLGCWTLVADADELLLYPGMETTPLPAYLAGAEFAGANAVRVHMLDMYPEGPLAAAPLARDPFAEAGHVDRAPFCCDSLARGPYGDSPTWTSALRHRLMPGAPPEQFVTQKIALVKYAPWMRFSTSLHYATEIELATPELLFAHFKYHAAFHEKAEREIARGQYYNNAEEYRMYRAMLAGGNGTLFDPAISVPWRDCAVVRALLDERAAQPISAQG